MYYTTIQLSKLNVPQYRDRLWCFPVRKDIADAIGGPPLPEPTASESPRIGEFLRGNSTYYIAVMPASVITPANFQVHYAHKPHLVGSIQIKDHNEVISIHQVWGDLGLSPCISCSNRIFIQLDGEVVEITLEGLAALQGIPLSDLPSSIDAARKAIGNGINRTMHEYAMSMGIIIYTNQYLLDVRGKRDDKHTHNNGSRRDRTTTEEHRIQKPTDTSLTQASGKSNSETNHTDTISRIMAVLSQK
jgi:hypothetical protein